MNKKGQSEIVIGVMLILLIIIGIGVMMWGFPKYKVYSQEMRGKADLKEAEWNKQIAIEEAKAELDSADLIRQADIVRAEGIAESNRIIAQSLTKEYIQWKWVEGLHDGSSEVVYVPTEANLPLLEARNKNE